MQKGENYHQVAARLAQVLRDRLSDEEFADLLDIEGDYTTADWFYKALSAAAKSPPDTPNMTVWDRLRNPLL